MKALIKVGYACNDHCTFCHTRDVRGTDDDGRRVLAKIERAAALGHTMAVLSGGEPTIRPELIGWAERARDCGLQFGLVTNGRMLSYEKVRRRLLSVGLHYVYLSLHGGTAAIHDACVQAEAFEQTVGGLRGLVGRVGALHVNCVVNRLNLEHLRGVVDLLSPLGGLSLTFSMAEAKGAGLNDFDAVVPTVTDAARAVRDAIEYASQAASALRTSHGGLPLCLLPGLEGDYSDLRTHGFATMTEVWEDDFHPVDELNRAHADACRGCSLQGPCAGLYLRYLERRGDDELRPVCGPRSNSFNYVPIETLPWPAGERCPVLVRGVTAYDRARALFLRENGALTGYRTATRDFADTEILAVKRRAGQLYLDISEKPAPDDFARDLRKLHPLTACDGCPESERCAGAFEPDPDEVFARDDARLRATLGELRGEVLDVGCGDGRYLDVLLPLVDRALLRYRGVDPDPSALERLRDRFPTAEVSEGRAEELELPEETLDHVLLLRSFNHLRAPAPVLRTLVRALRPGGTLLVADNVPFGLLRSSEQAERAESGPAIFEHYRNDGTREAEPLFAELPVELIARHEVRPDTSNQWLLHYRRVAS